MPPHKIRQEWLTLDEAAEVIRQHNITLLPADLIRHALHGDLPLSVYFPSPVLLRPLPLCLPIQQAALSTFAVQQTRQPQSDGELSAVQTRSDSATDHQPSVEFAVNRP